MSNSPIDSSPAYAEVQEKCHLLCPSAQPEWEDAKVFGIVGGTAEEPRLIHLTEPQPVTDELLSLTAPVKPTEVLRIAAPCAMSSCQHFNDTHCTLVSRTVIHLQPVTEKLPPCQIRTSCRWWHQEGKAACMRCPQIVTDNYLVSEPLILAATPEDVLKGA